MGPRPRHRLAAVWFADISDYSRLAGRDETAAFRLVREFQAATREAVGAHDGEVVKFMGDGALARFGSTDDAVRAAHTLRDAYLSRVGETRIEEHPLRIGVHVGDVLTTPDGDVYGDGVNVADRIEHEAGPDQVVVSEDVWRQLRHRSEFRFEPLGERDLPGIGRMGLLVAARPEEAAAEPVQPGSKEARTLPEAAWRALHERRWATAAVFAISVLVVAAILHFVTRDASSPTDVQAETGMPAPAVAVLPFQVTGDASAEWREGMVDLLSTNLNGVEGIRAIDGRTILARWSERVAGDATPDVADVLGVGRATGATYAVLGSAVGIGRNVRIVADVYELASGRRVGQSRAEGAADSVFALVDQLTIDLLGYLEIGGVGGPESVGLARVTTDSLEALKAFLEGEARFRRSDFEAAFESFQRAARIDTTFSLALFRMGQAAGFGGLGSSRDHLERAARHARRLSEREWLVLRGALTRERGRIEAIGLLEEATRRHPDAATGWFELGEAYYHLGAQALLEPGVSEPAFERALELDPDFSPAYIHLITNAFALHADSARARRLLGAFVARAPNSIEARLYPSALALAFGDTEGRRQAWTAFDRADPGEVVLTARNLYWHPRLLRLQEAVYNRYGAEPSLAAAADLRRGRLGDALDALSRPEVRPETRAIWLYRARAWGLPVPEAALEAALGPSAPLPDSPVPTFFRGAYATDRGRWREHAAAVRGLDAAADSLRTRGEVPEADFAAAAALALRGYREWREGSSEEAYAALERARREATGFFDPREQVNATIRTWLAALARERGDVDREIEILESFWGMLEVFQPLARLEAARGLERADRRGEARAAREYFATAWADADPALLGRREEGP